MWLIRLLSSFSNTKYASIFCFRAQGNCFKQYKDYKSLHTIFSLTTKPKIGFLLSTIPYTIFSSMYGMVSCFIMSFSLQNRLKFLELYIFFTSIILHYLNIFSSLNFHQSFESLNLSNTPNLIFMV